MRSIGDGLEVAAEACKESFSELRIGNNPAARDRATKSAQPSTLCCKTFNGKRNRKQQNPTSARQDPIGYNAIDSSGREQIADTQKHWACRHLTSF
jgi:hypothetical protein